MSAPPDPSPTAQPPTAASPRASAEQLVREFNQTLIRVLQSRLGSYEDAREVAQEAYAKLLNLGDEAAISFHRAYLFRIAHNLATDLLRKRAHVEQPAPAGLDLWPDPGSDPARSAHALQAVERLPALLAELPANCAESFRLVRVRQLSFAEAAEVLGLSERMVRIHVARALAYCQERLDGITDAWEGEPR
ncbi:RNA polymerase sigma factor [Stenotrophomonas mori]|uniref:RNA polymerase sigma factor n=1 Tax=Stenotrophomonas mori TaxID=2871096 RepID=A0ABT0SJM0_9GAMM|nr:RNA polymerase sigma factor [Stenotrophomonas mori]MCL7715530.1 RNA polymerase sigma factor [Stenotrophomonas mori]